MEGERLINKLFTDKLGAPSLEVGRDCPLDSATPSPSAYSAHASGSPPIKLCEPEFYRPFEQFACNPSFGGNSSS